MKVHLLNAHTHAGLLYPSGHVLDLPQAQALWLIGLGAAKAVLEQEQARRQAKPKPINRDTTHKGE